MNTKQCRKCKTDKDLSEFGKDRECKMVLDAYTQRPYDTEQVMLEEMLKMSKEGTW